MRRTLVAITVGAGALALLGASSATAVPPCPPFIEPVNPVDGKQDVNLNNTNSQGNCADNQQQQQQQNNVWTQQNQPDAVALADASGNSATGAGGSHNVGLANGNGAAFSNTTGGTATAVAVNANVAIAPQTQTNNQDISQRNRYIKKQASVYGSAFTAIGQ